MGRYEDLETSLEILGKTLGRKIVIPHAGKTVRVDYREVYSPAMADLVAERFKKDIACYDYEFE